MLAMKPVPHPSCSYAALYRGGGSRRAVTYLGPTSCLLSIVGQKETDPSLEEAGRKPRVLAQLLRARFERVLPSASPVGRAGSNTYSTALSRWRNTVMVVPVLSAPTFEGPRTRVLHILRRLATAGVPSAGTAQMRS